MGKRLMNVLYALLHIPILFIIGAGIAENDEPYNYSKYIAVCSASQQPVVLQGETENKPYLISHYELYNNDINRKLDQEKDLRFYCQYQQEIDEYIDLYVAAGNNFALQREANLSYFEFKESKEFEITPVKNYSIELYEENIDWFNYYLNFLWILIGAFLYYVLLQLVKLVYQYIVFGKVKIHPYKNP